ncbi:MAG: ABC transporter substrate-binding protein [Mangrovibacterium sp.]
MKKHYFIFTLLSLFISCTAIAQPAQRIISLVPAITKSIYQLGAQKQLVGCTSFCQLQNENDAQIVSSAVKVNMEKCLLLKPDLIITSSLIPRESVEMFQKLGIQVLDFSYPKSFDEICSQFITLSTMLGKESNALLIVDQAKNRLKSVQSKISKSNSQPSVFMQIGANPLFAVVQNTFMNDFITFAGCRNIAENMTRGSIARETVLVQNPDYIIVVFMGSMGRDESDKWRKFSSLKAVKENHIFELDANLACSPTPNDFVTILEQIITNIYP